MPRDLNLRRVSRAFDGEPAQVWMFARRFPLCVDKVFTPLQ